MSCVITVPSHRKDNPKASQRSAEAGRASHLTHSGRYPILDQNGPDRGFTCA